MSLKKFTSISLHFPFHLLSSFSSSLSSSIFVFILSLVFSFIFSLLVFSLIFSCLSSSLFSLLFSCLSSSLFSSLVLSFLFHLLSSFIFSFLFFSFLVLSCLVFSFLVLSCLVSLSLSLFLCLLPLSSFSVFFLSPCDVVLCVCVCVFACIAARWKKVKNPCVDSKTPPRVHSKRSHVCQHHAHMCFNVCAWCWYTRGRFESTHGGRFVHTHGREAGVIVSSAYQNLQHVTCNM